MGLRERPVDFVVYLSSQVCAGSKDSSLQAPPFATMLLLRAWKASLLRFPIFLKLIWPVLVFDRTPAKPTSHRVTAWYLKRAQSSRQGTIVRRHYQNNQITARQRRGVCRTTSTSLQEPTPPRH
eukprot:TRINITY_DN7132_c0_g1_i1.p2 TRINITY_DN7132_c0_g1~~TRINITY_DN7132_c0_g1_i1.p2  ORF type:complete len:124 (+),score=13.87 TRINITY_DN7132_c0_g1_i1:286-657(+)